MSPNLFKDIEYQLWLHQPSIHTIPVLHYTTHSYIVRKYHYKMSVKLASLEIVWETILCLQHNLPTHDFLLGHAFLTVICVSLVKLFAPIGDQHSVESFQGH